MAKHTPTPWEFSFFSHHTGRELKTNVDVAETTAFSAMQSESAELWGVAIPDKDEQGLNVVICYTGNGPTSKENAEFIARACSAHDKLVASLTEALRVLRAANIAGQSMHACDAVVWGDLALEIARGEVL